MLNKLWTLVFVLLLAILAGCTGGSYGITVGGVDASKNEISGEYNRFSGHYFKKVTIADGEALTATFKATTENGELAAKVLDADGQTYKTIKSGDSVKISQPGKYKMQVEGKKHKGRFVLSWKIE